ncbi:MAG: hypothetical protein LBS72_05130 [Oscillospiraceae bacterium]|jgi:hypothetical protein|nr:hypothetical protein [Oscillospiraceae bacterium]
MADSKRDKAAAWIGFILLTTVALIVGRVNHSQLFGTGMFDSFALQADAWREGSTHLAEDFKHLELAIYNDNYYVSFPPFPSVPIYLLKFIIPSGVPSGLLTLIYFLLCYPVAYKIARRTIAAASAAMLSFAALAGGSMLDVAVSGTVFAGAVWYQAQTLSLLLTLCAFYGVGHHRASWRFFGWLSLALAVGCRPFQAVYLPFLIWEATRRQTELPMGKKLVSILPMWIAPAAVAAALCWYNWIRFGSIFEFGHNYLPEFMYLHAQFDLKNIAVNFFRILRPPFIEEISSAIPLAYGFAVYATNPMLTNAACSVMRRKPDAGDILLMLTLSAHFFLLLMHPTFGGWQYGTRYICDLLPGFLALRYRSGKSVGAPECVYLVSLAAFNIAGTIAFHALSGR